MTWNCLPHTGVVTHLLGQFNHHMTFCKSHTLAKNVSVKLLGNEYKYNYAEKDHVL